MNKTAWIPPPSSRGRRAIVAAAAVAVCCAHAASEFTMGENDKIDCAPAPVAYAADGNPARVFVTDRFVFVLEQFTHRVVVYNRASRERLFHFGATERNGEGVSYQDPEQWAYGNGRGAFLKPFGLALDAFSGQNRFAVADTGNNRVQLFSFDPGSGAITFVAQSTEPFSEPQSVAFMEGGDLLVADAGNARVVRLAVPALSVKAAYDFSGGEFPTGICYDKGAEEGFWITDARNQRVAFYPFSAVSSPAVSFGTAAGRELVTPRDVQLLDVGDGNRYLCVVDNQGARLRILCARPATGAFADVVPVFDVGSHSDEALEPYQRLWRPCGVFPVPGTNVVYVADYGNNQVKWYGLSVDPSDIGGGAPPSAPDFEVVEWPFTAIAVEGASAATLEWAMPSGGLPPGGDDLLFRIGYKASLAESSWKTNEVPVNDVSVPQSAAKGAADVDMGGPQAFFRLWWLNKAR